MPTPKTVYFPVRYGDFIRLWASSTYKSEDNPSAACGNGGYIGYYEKNGRHGILSCIPPLGPSLDHLFCEESYQILDPHGQHAIGSPVHYGQTLVLVNQFSMVWNNKTGGITGYIGPRPRNTAGEMFVSFQLASGSTDVVNYAETPFFIGVEESNRHMSHYNKRLTNFKKPTSSIIGGYICSDGKGNEISFQVHPVVPKLKSILAGSLVTSISFGDPISITKVSREIIIELDNGGKARLTSKLLLDKGNLDSPFRVQLENAPGALCIKATIHKSDEVPQPTNITTYSKQILEVVSAQNLSIGILVSAVLLGLLSKWKVISEFSSAVLAIILWTPAVATIVYGSNSDQVGRHSDSTNATVPSSYTIVVEKWVFDYKNESVGKDLASQNTEPAVDEDEVPERFIRAVRGDKQKALARWQKTLAWRKKEGMDTILQEPHPKFKVIKANYPHRYHKRGRNNEPVYYERPGGINLKALKENGVTMEILLRHYALITEFLWTKLEPSESGQSITVIDVTGIGFRDFAGEVVDFVKSASEFTGAHYPERCASIFVVNVPTWFNVIWSVVKGMIDENTKKKVFILKGEQAIRDALLEKIAPENLLTEYGGLSEGDSEEEKLLFALMAFNNKEGPDPFLKS